MKAIDSDKGIFIEEFYIELFRQNGEYQKERNV